MATYLVFQAAPTPGAVVRDAHGQPTTYPSPDILVGYKCLGGIAAQTPEEAAKAAVAATRHIGKYALIEATFIDFGADLRREDDPNRPQLNP